MRWCALGKGTPGQLSLLWYMFNNTQKMRADRACKAVLRWWAMRLWIHIVAGEWGNCNLGACVLLDCFYTTTSEKEICNITELIQLSLQLFRKRMFEKRSVRVGLHVSLWAQGRNYCGGVLIFMKKRRKKRNVIWSKLEEVWLLFCKILVSLCLGK